MFMQNRNKIIIIAAIVLVLLIVLWANSPRQPANTNTTIQQEDLTKASDEVRVVNTPTDEIVKEFPLAFPFEENFTSSNSFKYVPAQSLEQQSTLEYTSQKTLAQNRTAFTNYLQTAGFEILNKIESSDELFYYATKDNNDLTISVRLDDNGLKVGLSYLKRPAN